MCVVGGQECKELATSADKFPSVFLSYFCVRWMGHDLIPVKKFRSLIPTCIKEAQDVISNWQYRNPQTKFHLKDWRDENHLEYVLHSVDYEGRTQNDCKNITSMPRIIWSMDKMINIGKWRYMDFSKGIFLKQAINTLLHSLILFDMNCLDARGH